MEVSIKSASVACEQIPAMHVRVLVFNPSPHVAVQLEYAEYSEKTKILIEIIESH